VETGQIQPWPGHQRRQAGDKIQRFQHDVGGTIAEGMFVAINDAAEVINGQPLWRTLVAGFRARSTVVWTALSGSERGR